MDEALRRGHRRGLILPVDEFLASGDNVICRIRLSEKQAALYPARRVHRLTGRVDNLDVGLAFACLFRNVPAVYGPGELDIGEDDINVLVWQELNSRLSRSCSRTSQSWSRSKLTISHRTSTSSSTTRAVRARVDPRIRNFLHGGSSRASPRCFLSFVLCSPIG